MNGKLNQSGELLIERAGVYKKAQCPSPFVSWTCSDSCALFQEPIIDKANRDHVSIKLCLLTINFSEFTDERRVKDQDA